MSVMVALDGAQHSVCQLPDDVTFVTPPPGLGAHVDFHVTALDDQGFMVTLRAAEDPQLRLFAVSPRPFFPDYAPTLSDEQRESIGVEDLADALVLTVVTRTAQGEFSANLLAPIVVNLRSGAAVQAVLDEDWPLRAPLGSQPSA